MPKLFPIVRRHLKALRRLRPDDGPDDYVFRYGVRNNVYWMVYRRCRELGIRWPKIFINLRASCATDLAERYPSHVCEAWLGHTERVANTHYRMVTEDYYRRPGKLAAQKQREILRSGDVELMQRALQHTRPGTSMEHTDQPADSGNCPENTLHRQLCTLVDKRPDNIAGCGRKRTANGVCYHPQSRFILRRPLPPRPQLWLTV
jgi:hypothetical protein